MSKRIPLRTREQNIAAGICTFCETSKARPQQRLCAGCAKMGEDLLDNLGIDAHATAKALYEAACRDLEAKNAK